MQRIFLIVILMFFTVVETAFAKTKEEQYLEEFYLNCYATSNYAVIDVYAESGQWKKTNGFFDKAMTTSVNNPNFKNWIYSIDDSNYFIGYGRVNYNSLDRGVCMMGATDANPDKMLDLLKKSFKLKNMTDSKVNPFVTTYEWKTTDNNGDPIWIAYSSGNSPNFLVLGVARK